MVPNSSLVLQITYPAVLWCFIANVLQAAGCLTAVLSFHALLHFMFYLTFLL